MREFRSEEGKKAAIKAMHLLEHMDRTEKGLSEKLRQSGFSESAAEEGMDYVRSFGYLDDGRYARSYIAGRMGSKSRQRILLELQQRGVDRQVAEEAWEEECEMQEPDERDMIRSLVEKKYPSGIPKDLKEQRRLFGYLERRGFQFSDIQSVLRREQDF